LIITPLFRGYFYKWHPQKNLTPRQSSTFKVGYLDSIG
jgi:hypothetical protein